MDHNRRRMAEEQRKRRIFNAKWRQIGLDVEALNHQVHEKALNRNKEEERERTFDEEAKRQSDLAELLEQDKNEEIRERNKKVDEYRRSQQRPEYQREFDLNDPNAKKRERPPRMSDDDQCPLSSLQKFHGEDLNLKHRSKAQKDQVRDLLLQQMQEKRLQNFKNDSAKHDWEAIMLQHDIQAQQIAQLEKQYNKEQSSRLIDANRDLASMRRYSDLQQKVQEDIEKMKDIEFQEESDLLTENPSVARSSLGPNRVVPDRWKGMTKDQLKEYHEGRIRQMVEKQRTKQQEERENAKWDEILLNNDIVAQLCEEEQKSNNLERNKRLGSENNYLAQEQKCQQEFLNNVVYRNCVTKDYFDQFNTTSR